MFYLPQIIYPSVYNCTNNAKVFIIYGYFMSIVSTKQLFIPLLAFQLIVYQVVMSIVYVNAEIHGD